MGQITMEKYIDSNFVRRATMVLATAIADRNKDAEVIEAALAKERGVRTPEPADL
jgi:hypothetical protein